MQLRVFVLAGVMAVAGSIASAGPVMMDLVPNPLVSRVHHKDGHRGGPPWARRGHDRDGWREEGREYRSEREYLTACRTVYRTEFDPYWETYRRRPVRVCREGSSDRDYY
jgi:hypothetical protein